jgi:hypothetical protein
MTGSFTSNDLVNGDRVVVNAAYISACQKCIGSRMADNGSTQRMAETLQYTNFLSVRFEGS